MATTSKTLGRNITFTVEKDTLLIAIPVGKQALAAAPMSKSGKTKVFATTSGNQAVVLPDGRTAKLGINAYFDATE